MTMILRRIRTRQKNKQNNISRLPPGLNFIFGQRSKNKILSMFRNPLDIISTESCHKSKNS